MQWYFLIFSYIFLLFDCFEWVLIDCIEKHRVHSVLWQFHMGGSICLWYLHVFSMQWYFLIFSYYLTVSNGHSLTALKSEEFTLISGSFKWGGGIIVSFPYIFLLFDCFKWVLIDCIEKCRGHSAPWQFQMGWSITYIFLLFDCFKWVLIDRIEKCRGHSAHWQFQMGGSITYIFLLFDCFEWALIDHIEKHRGHSVLWQF